MSNDTTVTAEVLTPLAVQEPTKIQPLRPAFLDDAGDAELQAQAKEILTAILENPTDVQVTANVYGLGADIMGINTENVSLMESKIGEVMKEIDTGNPVAKSLVRIKAELDRVNPAVVGKTELTVPRKVFFGLLTRMTTYVPQGDQVLSLINERKDTVTSTIDGLKRHLWEGRDQALKNAIELGNIANQLNNTQRELQRAAYVGQLVWQELGSARDAESDPLRKQALTTLVNDLAMQVVDIQTVDTLNVQSRMAAETLIGNARKIERGVARVNDVLLPAVAVNLGVKAAARQQLDIVSSMNEITRAAEDTIVDTARQTREVAVRMEKMQTEGLVKAEALQKVCTEFEQMVIDLEKIRVEAESKARETSNTLAKLAETMRTVADPMTEKRLALATLNDKSEEV